MDRFQKELFEHADRRNLVSAIIETVFCLQLVQNEGEIDQLVNLSKHIVLRHDEIVDRHVGT